MEEKNESSKMGLCYLEGFSLVMSYFSTMSVSVILIAV